MSVGLLYFSLSCMTVQLLSFKKEDPIDGIESSFPSPTVVLEDPLRSRQDEDEDDGCERIVRSWAGAAYARCLPTLSHPSSGSLSGAYSQLVGHTPLLHLRKLSEKLHCDIYAKMESMNPSGTGKDRAVLYMLRQALVQRVDYSGGHVDVVEGTSGSTGIALAYQCNALGLQLHVVLPDDQAEEKALLLRTLGARVVLVPPCSIANRNHYVHTAKRLSVDLDGVFLDQFDNPANYLAHYEGTGPEIWQQAGRGLDAFVMSAGTGGTIAGVSRYLKEQDPAVRVVLADPQGSSLLHKVKYDVCYASQQAERSVRKHRYDSIVEGVGLDRVTHNFQRALVDDAVCVSDQEAIDTAQWLLRNEGLFVGSSSALNIAAAAHTAKSLLAGLGDVEQQQQQQQGRRRPQVVTIVCDHGSRHLSRFWNRDYVTRNYGLLWPPEDVVPAWLL